jgi:hypothetical protein
MDRTTAEETLRVHEAGRLLAITGRTAFDHMASHFGITTGQALSQYHAAQRLMDALTLCPTCKGTGRVA